MIGRTYLERGQPVVVLKRWGDIRASASSPPFALFERRRDAPRNVLIQRESGERVVRPFRGLRKLPEVG
jgi:hypothetical protein